MKGVEERERAREKTVGRFDEMKSVYYSTTTAHQIWKKCTAASDAIWEVAPIHLCLIFKKQAWTGLLSFILTYIYRETMLYVQIKRASSKDLTSELMLQHWKLAEHVDFEIIVRFSRESDRKYVKVLKCRVWVRKGCKAVVVLNSGHEERGNYSIRLNYCKYDK